MKFCKPYYSEGEFPSELRIFQRIANFPANFTLANLWRISSEFVSEFGTVRYGRPLQSIKIDLTPASVAQNGQKVSYFLGPVLFPSL